MEFDLTMLYLSKSYVVVPNLKLYYTCYMPFIWINIIIIMSQSVFKIHFISMSFAVYMYDVGITYQISKR